MQEYFQTAQRHLPKSPLSTAQTKGTGARTSDATVLLTMGRFVAYAPFARACLLTIEAFLLTMGMCICAPRLTCKPV